MPNHLRLVDNPELPIDLPHRTPALSHVNNTKEERLRAITGLASEAQGPSTEFRAYPGDSHKAMAIAAILGTQGLQPKEGEHPKDGRAYVALSEENANKLINDRGLREDIAEALKEAGFSDQHMR